MRYKIYANRCRPWTEFIKQDAVVDLPIVEQAKPRKVEIANKGQQQVIGS